MKAAIFSALRMLAKQQPQNRVPPKRGSSVIPVLLVSGRVEDYQRNARIIGQGPMAGRPRLRFDAQL